MMELIEVIRKQEIEIHKQRTIVAKQIKQLKHQAEVNLLFLNIIVVFDPPFGRMFIRFIDAS